jgi:methionyl-tRNA formyltransferase
MSIHQLRIIFMGTPDFAVPSLQALLDNKYDVRAVVTQPDRPKGRGRKLALPPVKILAEKAGLPVLQPSKVRTPEFLQELKAYNPDLILVAAYGRILTQAVLDLPRFGCINVHGSLLPKYRGAAPVQWAILNGEKEAGITIMQMDAGLDTGAMLLSAAIPISPEDTTGTLAPRLARLGGELLAQTVKQLKEGCLPPPVKQNDSLATLAPPLSKEDGIINWGRSAFLISCQIRGLDPWPKASTTLGGKKIHLFSPSVVAEPPGKGVAPGTICGADKQGLRIACAGDLLLVKEIQAEGGKRMPVSSYLQGHELQEGTTLI